MKRTIKPFKVNPRSIKSRDYLTVALISGVTKAGVHRDNRKHTNKYAARGKETMPAAVLAHAPHTDVTVDWERDTDLFRVYANIIEEEEDGEIVRTIAVKQIHLLDDALQCEAVINTSMFTVEEWDSIIDTVREEWLNIRNAD